MIGSLPRDVALPNLAAVFDPQTMSAVFGRAAALRAGLRVQRCRIDRVKYRPGRNCSVSYVLDLFDESDGQRFEQRIATRLCAAGQSHSRYLKATGRPMMASKAGPSIQHVADMNLFVSWLPNDGALASLADLYSDERLRERWLPEVVVALAAGGCAELHSHQLEVVQLVPEQRVCARIELQYRAGASAPLLASTLYVKAERLKRGALIDSAMRVLQASPAQRDGRLRTAPSLLWQAAAGLHWQQALAGSPLLDLEPQISLSSQALVGRQLAALHATPVPLIAFLTQSELRRQPARIGHLLGAIEPRWQATLTSLTDRLSADCELLRWPAPVTLHGDLHARNLLYDGVRLSMIDFDSIVAGPAELELGGWIADTIYRALLAGLPIESAAAGWRAFLQAYDEESHRIADRRLIAWCTAQQLLCVRAYRCASNLKLGQLAVIPGLIAVAQTIAAAGTIDAACESDPSHGSIRTMKGYA